MSKKHLLVGVSAMIAAATSLAGAASAQVTTQIYAGTNALMGPYMNQSGNCYGNPVQLVVQGSNLTSPTLLTTTPFNYTGAVPQNCATTQIDTTVQINEIQSGSGTNIKAIYSHSPKNFFGDTVPPGGNNTPFPDLHFGLSETPLGTTDVTTYNSGGVEQGVTFTATPGAGQYPIPAPLYGNLVQFPMVIAPLAIEYSSTYKKVRQADGSVVSYHFHIFKPNKDHSGGLLLDATTYCKIFNGQITDWNQIPTTLNGGVSLQDPADTSTFSVPLQIVGRSDSAGATSTWTRHLAAICPALITGNQYADSATTLPSTLQGPAWTLTNPNYGAGSGVTDVPGKYTRAVQTVGVADYIQFDPNNLPGPNAGDSVVQGRIGYNGADTALPYVNNTGNNTFGLNIVDILRSGTTGIEPSAQSAALAYSATIVPPTGANAQNPANWVQPASKTAAVAIPSNIKAYPIVGTTNFLGYTCYTDAAVTTNLIKFLNWYLTSTTVEDTKLGILAKSGSSPMPVAWRSTTQHTFLNSFASTNPLNLHILQAGTGPATGTNSQCHAITPGA